MRPRPGRALFYFAMGILVTTSIGASLKLRNDGIEFPDGSVQTTAAASTWQDTRRSFYITDSLYPGASALTACAFGFHMASFWEISDPSNVQYDGTVPGAFDPGWDMGSGPPTGNLGYVRTGSPSISGGAGAGLDNCDVWTSSSGGEWGTVVTLRADWVNEPNVAGTPWRATIKACTGAAVWCVED